MYVVLCAACVADCRAMCSRLCCVRVCAVDTAVNTRAITHRRWCSTGRRLRASGAALGARPRLETPSRLRAIGIG